MTTPQQPSPADPGGFHPSGPPAQAPFPPPPPPAGAQPPDGARRTNILTSRPAIGIGALIVGLILGTGIGGGNRPAAESAAPAPTVTATATATVTIEASASSAEASAEPTETAEEPGTPDDTTYKYGQKVGFSYEGVEITLKVDRPLPSTNMFDKNNLEAKLTVCNRGGESIDELSAEGMGLYAEDKSGGQYSLYGSYRSPEFPVYDYDSSALRPGKCRTGWVAFEDGRKAVRIAVDLDDATYSWSRSGS